MSHTRHATADGLAQQRPPNDERHMWNSTSCSSVVGAVCSGRVKWFASTYRLSFSRTGGSAQSRLVFPALSSPTSSACRGRFFTQIRSGLAQ